MQVPSQDELAFRSFLSALGYRYQEETANPAYRLFLKVRPLWRRPGKNVTSQ
jgi:hypothetical protein